MTLKRDNKGRFIKVSGPKKVSIEERRKHDSERSETPYYYHWPKGW
jgi:hypothetical protein